MSTCFKQHVLSPSREKVSSKLLYSPSFQLLYSIYRLLSGTRRRLGSLGRSVSTSTNPVTGTTGLTVTRVPGRGMGTSTASSFNSRPGSEQSSSRGSQPILSGLQSLCRYISLMSSGIPTLGRLAAQIEETSGTDEEAGGSGPTPAERAGSDFTPKQAMTLGILVPRCGLDHQHESSCYRWTCEVCGAYGNAPYSQACGKCFSPRLAGS